MIVSPGLRQRENVVTMIGMSGEATPCIY